ncbi:MAG TPA: polyprenyl synthetase family protein [Bacillota bacterium]|nr:polyprenyl synthetase family protein [Bacillota bacterium]
MSRLPKWASFLEDELDRILPPATESPAQLHAGMRYAMLGNGKRLRGCIALASSFAAAGDLRAGLPAALAIELVHGYSLVHDDLPAMDDSAWRRGQPSLHIAFDDCTAILAGDALLTLAFEVLVRPPAGERALRCVAELARAAGSRGMVGGQYHDTTSGEHGPARSEIDRLKTASLFAAAARCGGIMAGADVTQLHALHDYGDAFGMAYQLLDDLQDREEDLAAGCGNPLVEQDEAAVRKCLLGYVTAARQAAGRLGTRAGYLTDILDRLDIGEEPPG